MIRGAVLLAALAALCALAPSAGAVLVRIGKHHLAGVTLAKGVRPTSVPGSLAQGAAAPTDEGTVSYHGGPVLHGSSPYLIFWDPHSELTSSDRTLFQRYFADVAADSGDSTDVFGTDRQYTDSSGFADYDQSWSSSHAIIDKQPYPTSGQCTDNAGYTETACLFDSQLQDELSRVISAHDLPTGTTGDAPIYFIVTPPDVNSCIPGGGVPDQCADSTFCAFHSSYSDDGSDILYADIPTVLAANSPKLCQMDGNSGVQSPNANPLVDVALKYVSHEDNETITDPLLSAWWDSSSGNEIADNCNATGAFDPPGQTNPNAFAPTLGGSASAGTLFDQRINSHHYYTQSVWSNGDGDCVMDPTSSALSAAFAAPASGSTGHMVGFDPSASSSAGGYSSTTWDFGDGSSAFSRGAPGPMSHTYTAPGTYQVTLTLVDVYGNLSTTSQPVTILPAPRAAFTSSSGNPQVNTPVSFDGSASSEPAPGKISSYSWNFGDGSSGSGQTVFHTYASPGVYTVSLTVSDGTNNDTVSQLLIVHGLPSAAFAVPTVNRAAGSPISFDGSPSSEPNGSISTYSWNFGDGSPAVGGAKPSHAYARAGTYTVRLTVADPFGNTATSAQTVTVTSVLTPRIAVGTARPVAGAADSFGGAASTDVGASISSYNWNFGDGARGSGASVSHRYAKPGSYTVTLTTTDSAGATSATSTILSVRNPAITAVSVKKGSKVERITLTFSGSGALKVGHKKFKVGRAGNFVLKVRLTPAQIAAHRAHRSLTIKVKLRFAPTFGNLSRRTVTIRLRG